MRKILLSILAIAGIFSASAQSRVFNNPNNKGYFGLRGTIDGTVPGKFSEKDFDDHLTISHKVFGAGAGLSVGAIYNLPVYANLYFEPGMSIYYNAMSIKKSQIDDLIDDLDEMGLELKNHSVRKWGMKIPVVFGYHFDFTKDFNIAVFTGPVMDIGFSMDAYIKAEYKDVEIKTTPSLYTVDDSANEDNFNRFNVDWRIGVGANYKNFFWSLSGDIRLTNEYHVADNHQKYYDVTYRQNLFQMTFGYNFK